MMNFSGGGRIKKIIRNLVQEFAVWTDFEFKTQGTGGSYPKI